ncbi:dihydrofolate reductase [Scatolibacter rhodanostii]|uniref:dihydrofolate reductase n=1 Tax=Scatolibacter rhodanostii TaxID=2014781 RepID=UPI000C08366A|nr:dihydrofolate reductase [Scatolibacter rhodanostii]
MNCILSVSENWGIGKDNKLLFHLPSDMAFFKAKTMGNVVVMGHSTLKSLPGSKPLPNRMNIVLSRHLDSAPEGTLLYHSMEELLPDLATGYDSDSVYIIGGESIYKQFLPYCHQAFITKVQKDVPADRFFPNLDNDPNWVLADSTEPITEKEITFTICTYENKNPLSI